MRPFLAAGLLLALAALAHAQGPHNRVHMSDITALTFYKDGWTTARRGHAIRQLECVGGSARSEFAPSVVQCTRTGWDGYDAQVRGPPEGQWGCPDATALIRPLRPDFRGHRGAQGVPHC